MKTITLTDEQFDNLFNYLDEKVNFIVDKSIDYQDSEILNEWEDLIEVYDIIEDIKVQHERKLQAARAKQPKACLLYTSPSPRDVCSSRMPSSA